MKLIEKELGISEEILKNELFGQNNLLSEDINNFLFSKSKKIRSKIIFLSANALEYKKHNEITYLAGATELIHNATLLHDDVIDNSNVRRGKKSLNAQFGNHTSILAGDLLLAFAMNMLRECNNIDVFSAFANSLKLICEGEINQQFNKNKILSIEEYIEKSEHKTAELFKAPLFSLCLIENHPEYMQNITDFAKNYGIAFQIKDDLLNIIDTDPLKPALCDIYNGIYTAPVIFFNEITNIQKFSKNELISNIKNNSECIEKTKQLINKYTDRAINSLEFLPKSKYKQALIELTNELNV